MKSRISTYLVAAVFCASLVSCSMLSGIKATREINNDKVILLMAKKELIKLRSDIIADENIQGTRLQYYNDRVVILVDEYNRLSVEAQTIDKVEVGRYLDWREEVLIFSRAVHKLKMKYQKESTTVLDKPEGEL